MSNWKQRYEVYKEGLGLINKDIAESVGLTLNSVEVMVNKKDGSFPKWAKLAIITYEQMVKNGRITYDEPEVYKVETDE
tara:strand:- start:139 stop:375 length:237 start_codon:yes stop_codon:yes gene_type:complete